MTGETITQQFVGGYINCLLFTSVDDNEEFFDINYGKEDIAKETMERIEKDCIGFIEKTYDKIKHNPYQAGIDFFYTRNGHGVGFWDRPEVWGEDKDELTEIAEKAREVWFYNGDDGKIYC